MSPAALTPAPPRPAPRQRPLTAGSGYADRHRARPRGPLVDALDPAQREIVAAAARRTAFRRRARIFGPGDPSDDLFLVASGVVKLSVLGAAGRELILAFLHPGDAFGELAVVDASPRDHAAEAYDDTVVHALGADVVRRLMRESSGLTHAVTGLLGARLRAYCTRVEELLCRSARARVAHTLADLAARHGIRDAAGIVVPLRLSQRDIGNMVGLTRETVNVVLRELRARDLVETAGRSLRVKGIEALLAVR